MIPQAQEEPRWQIWPYAVVDGRSTIPEHILRGLWDQLEQEDKVQSLFHDGSVTNADQWVKFLGNPGVSPVISVDTEGTPRITFIGWLSDRGPMAAKAHFVSVGPYQRGAARAILRYWDSLIDDFGNPCVPMLVGVTPESNEKALRTIKTLGFKVIGTLPNFCAMAYEHPRKVGGVISYREREA